MPVIKIPKKLRQVSLWIHPEGQVIGSLFLKVQTKRAGSVEEPLVVLNEASPFLVMQREAPDELRFYNKSSIVRVEYREDEALPKLGKPLHCRLDMMDGSLIEGSVWRELPPRYARLYDYLNITDERFLKLYVDDDQVCLVNKAYIVCVVHLPERGTSRTRERPPLYHFSRCEIPEPLLVAQDS